MSAICHGVQLFADTKNADGKSVLHDVGTTALPGIMESSVYHGTRLLLGDYYKAYGHGSPNVETIVRNALDDPSTQWFSSASLITPFVVEDKVHNYTSGRWPGDSALLAEKTIEMVRAATADGANT
jgi:putative intracellular protease/amidase